MGKNRETREPCMAPSAPSRKAKLDWIVRNFSQGLPHFSLFFLLAGSLHAGFFSLCYRAVSGVARPPPLIIPLLKNLGRWLRVSWPRGIKGFGLEVFGPVLR